MDPVRRLVESPSTEPFAKHVRIAGRVGMLMDAWTAKPIGLPGSRRLTEGVHFRCGFDVNAAPAHDIRHRIPRDIFEGMLKSNSRMIPSRCVGISLMMGLSSSWSASLRQVVGFGNNPSGIKMHLYVPDKVAAHPPILVGLHWCHGSGPAFHSGTGFASLADKYGFIAIYPSANSGDSCWDVHSTAALTHNGGSDPSGIVSMVRYVVKTYGADSNRVFSTGHSSGGMMTNVLLGSYPDVFKAGASFAGVPFSCFAGSGSWNGDCAGGKVSRSGVAWGDAVRAAYPGYAGSRPRVQLWHGTQDAILDFRNFGEAIKQWTNVLGASATPSTTENNALQSGWIRTRYRNSEGGVLVEAIQETGQPHNLRIMADQAVAFLGLDGSPAGVQGADQSSFGSLDNDRLRVFQDASRSVLRIDFSGQPGDATFELRGLDGKLLASLGSQHSLDGSFRVAWKPEMSESGASHGARLLVVRMGGRMVESRCFTMLE